jgi:hypothetical protein
MEVWVAAGGVLVAIVALVLQWRSNGRALAAQAKESQAGREVASQLATDEREHSLKLAREDRIWAVRAKLYADIQEGMNRYVRSDQTAPPGDDLFLLLAQARILASAKVHDLLLRFIRQREILDLGPAAFTYETTKDVMRGELEIPFD